MFFLPIVLALLVGLGIGVNQFATRGRGSDLDGSRQDTGLSLDAERSFLHVLSFAGLMGALYAIAGLISLVIVTVSLRSATVLSSSDARTRASYFLAALIVGGPLWFGCWTLLQRRLSRSPEECNAFERRLFLATVFAVTSIVALFGLQTALRAVLSLPGARDSTSVVQDIIVGCSQCLVWGGAWFAYARLGRQERTSRAQDEPYDFALFVLAAFALGFTTIGLWEGIREIVSIAITPAGDLIVGGATHGAWAVWGPIVAWVVAGGGAWGAISRYDASRGGKRNWRVVYLYLVLLLAAPTALGGGIDALYETLRRVFGYHADSSAWLFLRDALPPLLIGGVFWTYHWTVLRRQAALSDTPRSTIPWPRRPAIALLVLAGLATAAPALIYLLWLALDSLRTTSGSLAGGDWWRDGVSASLAAVVVGGTV